MYAAGALWQAPAINLPPTEKTDMKIFLQILLIGAFALSAQAAETGHAPKPPNSPKSKYAGQETRAIKSLSPDDIADLRRGGGWGLAKAAELNGVPGPAHLLEMKDKIPLSRAQVAALTEIYAAMKGRAIGQGKRLMDLERALEDHFRKATITDALLRTSLAAISEARMELRYIHLATHLKTPGILSPHQIRQYNTLRGYSDANPCATVPEGHSAEMWRKHNGCAP